MYEVHNFRGDGIEQDMIDKHICMCLFIRRRLHHADALISSTSCFCCTVYLHRLRLADCKAFDRCRTVCADRVCNAINRVSFAHVSRRICKWCRRRISIYNFDSDQGSDSVGSLERLRAVTASILQRAMLCPLMCAAPVACSCQSGLAAVRCLGGC